MNAMAVGGRGQDSNLRPALKGRFTPGTAPLRAAATFSHSVISPMRGRAVALPGAAHHTEMCEPPSMAMYCPVM